MSNPEFHACPTCGYTWKHCVHGGHNCATYLAGRISELEALNETRLGEIRTTLVLLAAARREAAEAQALVTKLLSSPVEPVAWMVWAGAIELRPVWPPHKTAVDAGRAAGEIKSCTIVKPLYDQSALTAAIEAARQEEREACAEICDETYVEPVGGSSGRLEGWEAGKGYPASCGLTYTAGD